MKNQSVKNPIGYVVVCKRDGVIIEFKRNTKKQTQIYAHAQPAINAVVEGVHNALAGNAGARAVGKRWPLRHSRTGGTSGQPDGHHAQYQCISHCRPQAQRAYNALSRSFSEDATAAAKSRHFRGKLRKTAPFRR